MTECVVDASVFKSHRDWRKHAKKMRRKKTRQKLAEERNKQRELREKSPTFLTELAKKKLLEEYELELEEKKREEDHAKWIKAEEEAQKLWREQERLRSLAKEERLKEQERIRQEWEAEQKKKQKQKEELEKIKKKEEERKEMVIQRIDDFILHGGEVPSELQIIRETNPGREGCSFFNKVGSCRFGIQCSRNHRYPGISNVLLFFNFYTHFTLEHNRSSEYDTDIGLEYDESEMYSHFKEFYNDVVPEFKSHGKVTMVKVCCNTEIHLRGNVYVEFKTEREALIAYRKFHGRWYGGKQLNVEFVTINDWGNAVCGDFVRSRCPKGKSCNFLHVFKNPYNEFPIRWTRNKKDSTYKKPESFDSPREHESRRSSRRDWRWSETPERTPRSLSNDRDFKDRKRERSRERKRSSRHRDDSRKRRRRSSDDENDSKSRKKNKHRDDK